MIHKVNIIRGIINIFQNEKKSIAAIEIVGDIKRINELYLPNKLAKNEQVIGVLIGDKFNIVYDITLNNQQTKFGYIVGNGANGILKLQLIDGFSKFSYNHCEPTYKLGKEISINESEIKDVTHQWKDLFKTEFASF
jgi:hypothetical protein